MSNVAISRHLAGHVKIPVTVVVPVKNEESNITKCLRALSRFERVIVVDSGSVDRTVEIASAAGADVLQFEWDGGFPKKRNWILFSGVIQSEWVLFIDADEVVSNQFCNEVALRVADRRYVGYWLNYTNVFLGKPLKFGERQRKLGLFRLGSGFYEKIEEKRWSGLDMEIHEHPIISGPVGELKTSVEHRDYKGLTKFIERHNSYVEWEVRRVEALRNSGPESWAALTDRQRFKYRHIDKWWFSLLYVVVTYVLRGGVFDGAPGFAYAFYKAWYFSTIRLVIREREFGGSGRLSKTG